MSTDNDPKPASHNEENFKDSESVGLVNYILTSHKRVMPKLDTIDKWPNIDGNLELQDSNRNLIGKLEVQIKTLPKKHEFNFDCPVSFLSYCENSSLPVLLFGVDKEQEKIYWLHMSNNFLKSLNYSENKTTKRVHFDDNQYFDKDNRSYIDNWVKIIVNHKLKINSYDNLKRSYEKLRENSNEAIGKERQKFVNIHYFLDEFNYLLDNEFNLIKNELFKDCWKIGLAYYNFNLNNISYALYSIPLNKNDVQIKEVSENLYRKLEDDAIQFAFYSKENPILNSPRKHARNEIKNKLDDILDKKLLDHTGNLFLAKEFVFAFIDEFYIPLGLGEKNTYSLEKIEESFYKYLPLWVEETVDFLVKNRKNFNSKEDCFGFNMLGYKIPYFDPAYLLTFLSEEERSIIESNVRENLDKKEVTNIYRTLGNKEFPFGLFTEFLAYLNYIDKEKIERVYRKKDFSRFNNRENLLWNTLSIDDVEYNLKLFIDNFKKVYLQIIENNFPLIKDKLLQLKNNIDRIVYLYYLKEEYVNFTDNPTYEIYYLKSKESKISSFDIEILELDDSQRGVFESFNLGENNNIFYKDKIYEVKQISRGELDFIYKDLPMLNQVYDFLSKRIEEYFNK